MQPTQARIEQIGPNEDTESSMFPPLPPKVARNFLVTDIQLETPPTGISASSYDRPFRTASSISIDRSDFLAPFRGLEAVPPEIKDLLPGDCRKAFDQALDSERTWRNEWGDEKDKKCRRMPIIDKAVVPYTTLATMLQ